MQGKRRKLCIGDNFPLQFDANGPHVDRGVIHSSNAYSVTGCVHAIEGHLAIPGLILQFLGASAGQVTTPPIYSISHSYSTAFDSSKLHASEAHIDGKVSGVLPNPGIGELAHIPFAGDFRGGTWNTQALFAAKCHRQFPKMKHAMFLASNRDFFCYQETHSVPGRTQAFTMPGDRVAFWSHGTRQQAGICIILKRAFLSLFNPIDPDRQWEIINSWAYRHSSFGWPTGLT
jgi:hypothetical protein